MTRIVMMRPSSAALGFFAAVLVCAAIFAASSRAAREAGELSTPTTTVMAPTPFTATGAPPFNLAVHPPDASPMLAAKGASRGKRLSVNYALWGCRARRPLPTVLATPATGPRETLEAAGRLTGHLPSATPQSRA